MILGSLAFAQQRKDESMRTRLDRANVSEPDNERRINNKTDIAKKLKIDLITKIIAIKLILERNPANGSNGNPAIRNLAKNPR